VKKILVVYNGWGESWVLGTLADNGKELLFEYSSVALQKGLELSPYHLKLRKQAYGNFPEYQYRLPGLIADSLPDGWGLLLMDRLFRKARRKPAEMSPLDRLAFIGNRGLGALSFEHADAVDFADTDVKLLTLAEQTQVVVSGKDTDALRQLALMGGSPQGARPKILVYRDPQAGAWSAAPMVGGEPWLVKFQAQSEHKEVCALEALYAQLARACGLDMPATQYFDLARKLAGFGAVRFDVAAGYRVPVHTLAGILHADFRVPSAVDYTTFLRVTRFITHDEREVKKVFERAVFNVVFNNRDDHCKNFSFRLGRDLRWKLAPCYDLTFSAGPGGQHHMDVCGEGRHVTRAKLLELALQGGLNAIWAVEVIDRIAECAGQFRRLAADWQIRKATVKQVEIAIASNRKRLA
jgi:serine/threonine-protein kinase HipA